MATQPDELMDDDFQEDDPNLNLDDEDDDTPANDDDGESEGVRDEEEDVVVYGGAEQRGEEESEGIRNLREELKRQKARIRELEGAPAEEDAGERPSLEAFDYDEDRHADALAEWLDKRRRIAERRTEAEVAARRQQERWESQSRAFEDSWSAFNNRTKDAARAKVEEAFDSTQQAMLVKASRGNGAGLFYLLGTNPEKLAEIKALTDDPAEFIAAAAVIAKEAQVTRRKPETQPETRHRGSAPTGNKDAVLERLEREAERSGDYTKLARYQRDMKEKKRG